MLLTCHWLLSTETLIAKPVFERAVRAYGLPSAIWTDNGVPVATSEKERAKRAVRSFTRRVQRSRYAVPDHDGRQVMAGRRPVIAQSRR